MSGERRRPRRPTRRLESSLLDTDLEGAPLTAASRTGHLRGSRIISFAGAVVCAALLVFVFSSNGFRVKTVVAAGNSKITLHEIQQLAHADGLRSLLVDTRDIERRVSSLPYVRTSEALVVLPDTVQVRIQERTPYLGLHFGSDYVLVDKEGVVLECSKSAGGTVEVAMVDGAAPEIGSRLPSDMVIAFQKIAEELIKKLSISVTRIQYSPVKGIEITVGNRQVIEFGLPTDLDRKMAIVHAFLATDRTWQTLDVSSVDRPYYKQ